jgi:hypothetical protein
MNDVLFYHGETIDGRRFTIAGNVLDDAVILATAVCSSKDTFVKKIGRLKSQGRLESSKLKGKIILPVARDKEKEGKIQCFLGIVTEFNRVTSKNILTAFHLMNNR